jgi:hypothetical protein
MAAKASKKKNGTAKDMSEWDDGLPDPNAHQLFMLSAPETFRPEDAAPWMRAQEGYLGVIDTALEVDDPRIRQAVMFLTMDLATMSRVAAEALETGEPVPVGEFVPDGQLVDLATILEVQEHRGGYGADEQAYAALIRLLVERLGEEEEVKGPAPEAEGLA